MVDIKKEIEEYLNKKEYPAKERDYFYVSEIGKSKKEIYNSFKKVKKDSTEARVKRIFENGDYVHMRYMKYFAEMGILIAAEVEAVSNELLHGRADCIISDKKELYVVELKSISQWSYQKLKEPLPEHVLQLMTYMYYLNISKGIILYECKDNQDIKTFDIELKKDKVEKVLNELKILKEQINNNIEPPDEAITLEEIQY